ncbi:circularly permuted ATPgrasp domain protein [Leptospira tipperaryensis]|uniref:Circularly permuted ATPgrasp domain protein n=1 Tax=Leptospira tipperaryensis TaxID=2564040 RepID=A0A1D7UUV6_9LEPT|nr:circularly permuted ATPgrasp domain protein [Leptospira tipperaryensis]AOP33376.1 circularly permuted ATPgrasp domain protein [Leptospira tipperaryensis]
MTTVSKLFNRECQCITIEKEVLDKSFVEKIRASMNAENSDLASLTDRFFASSASFLDPSDFTKIQKTIQVIQKILKNEKVRKEILKEFPENLKGRFSKGGVFLSFDFHLAEDGPKLIEINTNAGGAFLQTKLVEAQKECCPEVREALASPEEILAIEKRFFESFLEEWRSTGKEGVPTFVAIVDKSPKEQFLYPEFLLFREMFLSKGIPCEIVEPESLTLDEDGSLFFEGKKVDLIYNRLTDFYLSELENQKIRSSWEQEKTVVTPNPLDYELYAKKTNLVLWKKEEFLREAGVEESDLTILAQSIPLTGIVKKENSEELWKERKKFFFKPASGGYGSKAAYRGDKLTKGTFQEILEGDNIFQEIVLPSERILLKDGEKVPYKMDLRTYVYQEEILLLAARLYQGQTTNFRTPGGGFSPVYVLGMESSVA